MTKAYEQSFKEPPPPIEECCPEHGIHDPDKTCWCWENEAWLDFQDRMFEQAKAENRGEV